MTKENSMDESQVQEFLQNTPDFFIRHADLLFSLRLPHGCGDAISLLERQTEILRRERVGLNQRLEQMMDTSRENQRHYENLHKMTLTLLQAQSLDALVRAVATGLNKDFNIDMSLFYLRSSIFSGLEAVQSDSFKLMPMDDRGIDELQKSGPDLQGKCCCIIDEKGVIEHTNRQHGMQLASCAWVSLGVEGQHTGILVLGGGEERFHADMDTFFLTDFAECLSCKLKEFQDL